MTTRERISAHRELEQSIADINHMIKEHNFIIDGLKLKKLELQSEIFKVKVPTISEIQIEEDKEEDYGIAMLKKEIFDLLPENNSNSYLNNLKHLPILQKNWRRKVFQEMNLSEFKDKAMEIVFEEALNMNLNHSDRESLAVLLNNYIAEAIAMYELQQQEKEI